MVELIQKKHNNSSGMKSYYNSNNSQHVPALDQAYKEEILSCFIIMNGNMKEGCNKMLSNQQICKTKPFKLTWVQATLLLDHESWKVRMQHNKSNGGGREQDNKKDKETDSIVQCLMETPNSDVKDLDNDDNKSSMPIYTINCTLAVSVSQKNVSQFLPLY